MTAPITDEDRPHIEAMIKRLKRYRKREHANGRKWMTELDEAIKALLNYGYLKSWWDDPDE